jgi:hypothetical protein
MSDATLIGKKLLDCEGGMIGTIDDIVVDPRTLLSEWVKVRFGILRDRTLVPFMDVYADARWPAVCALTKRQVRDAPPVRDRYLDAATRHELLHYYGIDDPA